MTATTPRTKRTLTNAESFKLCTWYQEHKDRLHHMTDSEIRAEAESTLGIAGLTEGNIQGARTTLGISKRKPAPPPSADVAALTELVQEQAGKISELEAQALRHAQALQGLLDRVRRLETTR